MRISIYILLVGLSIFSMNTSHASEKFLKVKGSLMNSSYSQEITSFDVKVVLDDLDSVTTHFNANKFDIWLPANRKAKVYFLKDGFSSTFMIVDASFIPSFAYKTKQLIELVVKMSPKEKDSDKPFCIANFKANESKFILEYPQKKKKETNSSFRAPFPAPVLVFKGARPSNVNLTTITNFNLEKANPENPLSELLQGIIFAQLNYCIFNERVGRANDYLLDLVEIDKDEWSNIKPFDSPEYGAIVMKTLNREKSTDTLFAIGSWIGTSQLLMQSFTSSSKLIIHGKKLVQTLKKYKEFGLNPKQKTVVKILRLIAEKYKELTFQYTASIKKKAPIDLKTHELFLEIQTQNDSLFTSLVK